MKKYVALELEVLMLVEEDIITASADFTDDTTGDNGVWFPGQGGTQWQ